MLRTLFCWQTSHHCEQSELHHFRALREYIVETLKLQLKGCDITRSAIAKMEVGLRYTFAKKEQIPSGICSFHKVAEILNKFKNSASTVDK